MPDVVGQNLLFFIRPKIAGLIAIIAFFVLVCTPVYAISSDTTIYVSSSTSSLEATVDLTCFLPSGTYLGAPGGTLTCGVYPVGSFAWIWTGWGICDEGFCDWPDTVSTTLHADPNTIGAVVDGNGNVTSITWQIFANCDPESAPVCNDDLGGGGSPGTSLYAVTVVRAADTNSTSTVCAQACGYHYLVPSASGSLAETCFLTSNQNCLFCQDLLHLMSEAQQFAPCSGTVTPTATPTPVPTATPTPYPTSTFLPHVTLTPVRFPTIAHISGGINMGDVRGKIINSTGPLGNFSASYLDWIDGVFVQAAGPIYQVFELVDTPMKWIIDLANTILGIIESLVDEYLAYAEVPLEIIKMAVNSFPDKLKGLILYAMGWRLLLIGWKGL